MSAAIDSKPPGQYYCPTCEKNFEVGDRCPSDGTRLVRIAVPVDPLLGRELDGRYMILQKLGQGGMGAVYRGTQIGLGREVAIKVVSAHLVSEPDVVKRFLREAKLASRLSHPNAVAVLDFNQTEDGLFYLVMELVTGRTLDKVFEQEERALRPERVIRIAMQVCDALEGAHALSIVHRDLKPSNIMLLDRGRDLVKVLDFGLAKSVAADQQTTTMTNAGALLGTPAFIPPELALGEPCDGRADLYSLGVVIYLLGSGRLPFVSDSAHELIAMHASDIAPSMPGVPAPLAAVVDRMLRKSPAERYQTAAENREAFEEALDRIRMQTPAAGLPAVSAPSIPAMHVPAAPTPLPPESRRAVTPSSLQLAHSDTMVHTSEVTLPRRPRRWVTAAIATVIVVGVGGAYMAMSGGGGSGAGAGSGSTSVPEAAAGSASESASEPASASASASGSAGSASASESGSASASGSATIGATAGSADVHIKKPNTPKNHHVTTPPPPIDKTVPRDPPREPVKTVEPPKPPDPTVPPF